MDPLNDAMFPPPSSIHGDRSHLQLKLSRYSAVIIPIGDFLLGMVPFDLGLVSFALIILTGVVGATGDQQWTHKKARRYRLLIYLSHGFLSFNYLLGVIVGRSRLGFAIYCAVFMAIWCALMIVGSNRGSFGSSSSLYYRFVMATTTDSSSIASDDPSGVPFFSLADEDFTSKLLEVAADQDIQDQMLQQKWVLWEQLQANQKDKPS
ncbi:hypothetical protein FOZ60_002754 [Perkinsus olseni]|uniref:Uncharacterized protein n=1 Tax=Perkinsus olseni TaxID=32597 RepID=A0A7J6NX66_PEROL|nr:hypothetical protein FOZ60_002754 [Perkinsus olseni]